MGNKMKEWFEANQEIYAEFKSRIHSTLDILSQDGTNVAECDDTDSLQNMLLEAMTAKNMPVENIINTFSKAAEEGDVAACCMYCYLELDNGLEEIESAMTKFEQSTDAQYIKDGIKLYLQDKEQETQDASDQDLNLLRLRRWHYEHPKEYQEFTNLFTKAYEGDISFVLKGFSYLTELLSLDGIKGITELLLSLCPGTDSYNKAQFSNVSQQAHEKLTELFASTFNKEETKDKLQHNNPFLFNVFYWMIFDNGFVKTADLLSKTMMGEKPSFWQKNFGEQIMRSLMLTSMDKATYTKGTWKAANNHVVKDVANSALQESKGRRGRRQVCVLLEEMLIQPHAELLTNEIEKILTEWMEANDTDSILAYIFAALTNGSLLNDTYNYRTFHTAILEKFPSLGFKSGFDWAEALYNAIVSERGNDYNLSLSEKAVQTGKEQAKLISIRLRTLLSPNVY
ncbi:MULTISPECIES: DUF6043 family protein [Bacteroidales]|jgi:hypothetical protein|uniref:DUF6043 family protein n=1 Tax=Bacteroidales TaxID=171549 RepID=UPI0018991413|nr:MULTISPECIES: DUF6043 family protein [Bacteroidales]